MTWHQVGTVSKELPEIGWRTNVFPEITAVLTLQVGLMVHTRQSQKVWSLVKSVIIMIACTITGKTTAVTWVTILQSGTVGLSSCMSCKRRQVVISVTVVTTAEVICLICLVECVSNNQSTSNHHQSLNKVLKHSAEVVHCHLSFSDVGCIWSQSYWYQT